jgi:outer membrane lipoprotein-sorting protein
MAHRQSPLHCLVLTACSGLALTAFFTSRVAGNTPKDATTLVHLLESRYNSATSLKAAFLERYSQGARQMRIESGTAYFRRPGRMRWEYEEPEKKLFIADGKTVWFFVPADRTVTRAPMKESSDWRTPLALLTGKANLNRLCGHIEIIHRPSAVNASPSAPPEPPGSATLRCTPKEKGIPASRSSARGDTDAITEASPFDEILFEVDAETGDLADILIRQAGGVEMEYRFGNWQRGLPLADSLFHFHAPPGVAIVEEPSGSPSGR